MAAIIALTATCKRVWWRLRREYRTVVLPAYSADRRPQGQGDPFTHQVRFRVDLVRHPFTPTRCLVPAGGPLCHSRGAGHTYKYSFFPRTIPQWNALPGPVVMAPTVESFRARLEACPP
ncbi:hypothetical protein Bbelb_074380 [Branchiostoma belcheri]|nr:hypothetical protein Bbelb_074380 [Branchiostoma belcheri]